ncbi:hypothetical protein M408DRAFT_12182 [Serendipita vermifera MAFF 305830]|uniref:MYND-type domain-containing protein n=1 Tax=Serendipita vermifera MAFF 305830 TaxID=933852 RepID=A0A0C3ABY4_SERVB|nr:hypothetical protein M408DRAFT_12182 [Serendipita vermifera MAFF 305830]
MFHECRFCDNLAGKQCTGCKKAWYCSEKCQRSHWKLHIFDCKHDHSKPIIPAYRLYRAVLQDKLPEDQETCDDFGFCKAHSIEDKDRLFGLYVELFKVHKVEPITVHRWRKQGTLIQEIKSIFDNSTRLTPSEYYPWFLQNQHLLDPSWPLPQGLIFADIMQTWKFVNGPAVDHIEQFREVYDALESSVQDCFTLYHNTIIRALLSLHQDEWVTFGFVACPNVGYERRLLSSYVAIIIDGKCPFNDFASKFKAGRLIDLFRRYGVEDSVLSIPYMAEFLEDNRVVASVWWLKAYVYRDPGLEDMHPVVGIDYGINNCRRVGEYIALMKDTYKKVLEHPQSDPLELHEACVAGKIYPYVHSLLKLKKRDAKLLKELMRNPYSL